MPTNADHKLPLFNIKTKVSVLTGSGTFTPSPGCFALDVKMVGAGAGGASASSDGTNGACGGGGGAGGYLEKFISEPSASYSYQVGVGGQGQDPSVAVRVRSEGGGDTSLTDGTLTLLCEGGKGALKDAMNPGWNQFDCGQGGNAVWQLHAV